MKGHTKIELTDLKTNEVTVIEKDNMVTDALKYLLQIHPCLKSLIEQGTIIGELIGGVLLFESPEDEDVNNFMPNPDNKMVARGFYGFTYSGESTQLGSFNNLESGIQEDGSVRLVWDFNSSQGNGTISCVSLTSFAGAKSGLGDDIENVDILAGSGYRMYGNLNTGKAVGIVLYADYKNNIVALQRRPDGETVGTTGKLELDILRAGFSDVSIHDKSVYSNLKGDYTISVNNSPLRTFSIDVPDEVKSCFSSLSTSFKVKGGFLPYYSDGFIRFIFEPYSGNVTQGVSAYLWLVNPITGESSLKEIVNTSPGRLFLSEQKSMGTNTPLLFGLVTTSAVCSKYIFAPIYLNEVWKLCRISIEDNTDVVDTGFEFSEASSTGFGTLKFIFVTDSFIYFTYQSYYYILNVKKCHVKRINASGGTAFSSQVTVVSEPLNGTLKTIAGVGSLYYEIAPYPVPIITINNLQEPVVKTAAQSMKVIYTLSEE